MSCEKKRKTELKEKPTPKKKGSPCLESIESELPKTCYNTLTDFVTMLKTPQFDAAIPPPCLCKNNPEGNQRVAFANDTDQHKVEAALYNFAFASPIDEDKQVTIKSGGTGMQFKNIQGQNVYGDYGDCGFCVIMKWLLAYLPRLYHQRISDHERLTQEAKPESTKKKKPCTGKNLSPKKVKYVK